MLDPVLFVCSSALGQALTGKVGHRKGGQAQGRKEKNLTIGNQTGEHFKNGI